MKPRRRPSLPTFSLRPRRVRAEWPKNPSVREKTDKWLVRLSHVAQVGLLAVAVIVYFYTVVPIQQKEELAEQIVEKQKELKLTQAELRNARAVLTHTYGKAWRYEVTSFLRQAEYCSGVVMLILPFTELLRTPVPELKRGLLAGTPFGIDLRDCIQSQLKGIRRSEWIEEADKRRLDTAIDAELPELVRKEQELRARFLIARATTQRLIDELRTMPEDELNALYKARVPIKFLSSKIYLPFTPEIIEQKKVEQEIATEWSMVVRDALHKIEGTVLN